MKKSLFPILALLILHACQEPDLLPKDELSGDYIYASVESVNATKTSMDQNNNVLWSEGDQLVAFMKTTLPSRFQVMDESVGKTTGSFKEIEDEGDGNNIVSGNELDHNIVLYPFSSETSCMKSDNSTDRKSYKLNVVLPETQFYAEDSFAEGSFPMAAVSSSNSFTFKNICGGIKLQFLGVDKIRSIRLEGVDKEKISGQSSVVCYVGGESPVITMDADANDYVTLNCGEGVQLNESTPTTFIIAVPPVTFASGMKITVTDTDGLSKTLTNSSFNTIKRSYLLTFPVITYDQTGVLELPEDALTSYEVPAEGGTVEIPVITNQDYQVEISEEGKDWISVAETKALREDVIKLNVLENTTIQERSAEVLIASSSGIISQAIVISQKEGSMPAVDLSEEGTANSYIVSASGAYKFSTVKGNSSESVGAVASAEVLWETFGTDVTPNVGDLVKNAAYSDGYITFQTADIFKEGNALIAAKDASGTILWSWHIWLTDEPEGQVYYNNAGTMMDRNLGATSATPGDVGALGLFYQWGRKDPFLGLSSISEAVEAISTITWPSAVESNSSYGTIEYAISHPTTFITSNNRNYDWYYTGSTSTDNTRWTTSETKKSIYDPCPVGWRVPDGGDDGVWSRAGFDDTTYDSTNQGISFSISSPSTTWYPGSIYRHRNSGSLNHISCKGFYWSASPYMRAAHYLLFNGDGSVNPSYYDYRAYGSFVRCVQEESVPDVPEEPSEPHNGDYVDEYGINHGQGVEIDGVVWAPVNCGYHATDYKYGKLYQWGRKYGQGYEGPLYDENGNESGTYSDASVPLIVSDPVSLSVGQSSSNSNNFYYISSSPYDWVTPQDDTLWNSGTEDNPVKTEYDPCPEGWRVPTNAELNNLQSKYWSMTTNGGQEGCLFSGKVFFPAAGYRSYIGAHTYARGLAGIYWSSKPYDPGADNLDINTKGGYGVIMSGAFRSNGYSVRCVQE